MIARRWWGTGALAVSLGLLLAAAIYGAAGSPRQDETPTQAQSAQAQDAQPQAQPPQAQEAQPPDAQSQPQTGQAETPQPQNAQLPEAQPANGQAQNGQVPDAQPQKAEAQGAPPAEGRREEAKSQDEAKTKKRKSNSDADAKKSAKLNAAAEAASDLPAVLVDDYGDPRALNLYYGIGGQKDAPNPNDTYTFLEEDLGQTQPKFDVRDSEGRKWRVKTGIEPKPETAATRLVWAAGYFTDEDYYMERLPVAGLPHLRRGQKYSDGETVRSVRMRLESKNKTIGYWDWKHNPFSDTSQLNGLRVMMALVENWDLMTRNNKIYPRDGQRRFVVSDLGATFGRSGNELSRKKGDLDAYAKAPFIGHTTADTVDFVMHTRPLLVMALGLGAFKGMPDYYPNMVHSQSVVRHIPRADARAMGQRLSQLSGDQIRDCFRAAGYSNEEVDGFTNVVRMRIEQLAAL